MATKTQYGTNSGLVEGSKSPLEPEKHGLVSGLAADVETEKRSLANRSRGMSELVATSEYISDYIKNKARLQFLVNGLDRGIGIATNPANPLKTRVCEGSGGSEFREKFRLNAAQGETKRQILDLFLTLDEQDRREVLGVLQGVLKSELRTS